MTRLPFIGLPSTDRKARSRKPFILGSYLAPRTPIPSAQTVSPQMSPSTRGPSGSSTASTSTRPLNGVFGLHKPSGPTSMSLLDELKPLFASSSLFRNADGSVPADLKGKGKWRGKGRGKGKGRSMDEGVPPKIGQGGTLDPLADGVLVIGVGTGTKQLARFLDCTKEYRATGLLGTATTSYDSADPILSRAPYAHVTPAMVSSKLPFLSGVVSQLPPLYSAIRMDGKRLFEYAREGIPLPRPIERRTVTVSELRLVDWHEGGSHAWKEPDREIPEEEKALVGRVKELAGEEPEVLDTMPTNNAAHLKLGAEAKENGKTLVIFETPSTDANADAHVKAESSETSAGPPAFTLEMTVSSGTYVRSIVHDLAQYCGSAAHVVRLTRTRQGEFSIPHTRARARPVEAQAAAEPEAKQEPEAKREQDGKPGNEEEQEKEEEEEILPGNCIEWSVFERAIADLKARKANANASGAAKTSHGAAQDEDADKDKDANTAAADKEMGKDKEIAGMEVNQVEENGLREWERILLTRIIPC